MSTASAKQMYERVYKAIASGVQPSEASPPSQAAQIAFQRKGSPVVWTKLTSTGTLDLSYDPRGKPALEIYVWHVQGGTASKINKGSNSIPVKAGDFIVYILDKSEEDTIVLKYDIK